MRALLTSAVSAFCALGRIAAAGWGPCGEQTGPFHPEPSPGALAKAWRLGGTAGLCLQRWLRAGRGCSLPCTCLLLIPKQVTIPRRQRLLAENQGAVAVFQIKIFSIFFFFFFFERVLCPHASFLGLPTEAVGRPSPVSVRLHFI